MNQISSELLDNLNNLSRTKRFLGQEYLAWLWYQSETASGSSDSHSPNMKVTPRPVNQIKGPEATSVEEFEVSCWIDDRLVLEGQAASGQETVLRGGHPSLSSEAAVALLEGKAVKELRLGLHIKGFGDYSVLLSSADLHPRGVLLPQSTSEESRHDVTQEATGPDEATLVLRLNQTEALTKVLKGLFTKFIEQRIQADWIDSTLGEMRRWTRERSKTALRSSAVH